MKTLFRSFPATVLLALLPLGFLAVMVVAPLVAMAAYDGSAWSLVLADDYMQHRLVWTVVQAAVTWCAGFIARHSGGVVVGKVVVSRA